MSPPRFSSSGLAFSLCPSHLISSSTASTLLTPTSLFLSYKATSSAKVSSSRLLDRRYNKDKHLGNHRITDDIRFATEASLDGNKYHLKAWITDVRHHTTVLIDEKKLEMQDCLAQIHNHSKSVLKEQKDALALGITDLAQHTTAILDALFLVAYVATDKTSASTNEQAAFSQQVQQHQQQQPSLDTKLAVKIPNLVRSARAISILEQDLQIGNFQVTRFSHPSASAISKGTIMVIHGINPLGNRDPRLRAVARAMARLKYTVYMPSFHTLTQCKITTHSIDAMEEIMEQVILHSHAHVLHVFGASMSGSLAMIASTRPKLHGKIHTLGCVGSFACVATASAKVMSTFPHQDDYGRNILFYNFIHHAFQVHDSEMQRQTLALLQEALRISLWDSQLGRRGDPKSERLTAFLQKRPQVAKYYWRLQQDLNYRLEIVDRIIPKVRHVMRMLSPLEHIQSAGTSSTAASLMEATETCSSSHKKPSSAIPQNVVLIHGLEDDVVPVEQARMMTHQLKQQGVNVTLCVTPLIGHGDRRPVPPHLLLPSFVDIIKTMVVFLKSAATTPQGNEHKTSKI